jgi:hypothetical protein
VEMRDGEHVAPGHPVLFAAVDHHGAGDQRNHLLSTPWTNWFGLGSAGIPRAASKLFRRSECAGGYAAGLDLLCERRSLARQVEQLLVWRRFAHGGTGWVDHLGSIRAFADCAEAVAWGLAVPAFSTFGGRQTAPQCRRTPRSDARASCRCMRAADSRMGRLASVGRARTVPHVVRGSARTGDVPHSRGRLARRGRRRGRG